MDDKNGKNPLMAISAILALVTALGVVVYVQTPLKGTRPSIPEIQERAQKIGARLWQDPFQAVLDQAKIKNDVKPPGKLEDLCPAGGEIQIETAPLLKEIKEHLDDKKNVTILGVMVFGAPYEEEMETRLRKRYAVVSSLGRLGFVPEDAEHLGYVRIFQSQQECQEAINQPSLSTILPFEWFVSEGPKKSVLLLWINDDLFKKNPLKKLSILIGQLQSQTKKEHLAFKLIGPAGSTTLLEMLKEVQNGLKSLKSTPAGTEPGNFNFFPTLEGLEIYSATATAENFILDQELRAATGNGLNLKAKEDSVAAKFSELKSEFKFNITFHRNISSDGDLAKELVEELRRRGVGPGDHIALISEWDTFYGRSLPKSFENAWEAMRAKAKDKDKRGRILQFSYLRAIDGQLPGEREAAAKAEKKNAADRKEGKDIQKLEEPIGKSQYDYLRRLAERIYLKGQQLERQGEGKFKAIGVLGSDFYDKYLVLQALGQLFPEIIFFTTDLDARLLHPDNIEWTRNLVVASGFGLQLCEDLHGNLPELRQGPQGDLPPFRDAYQTSVYLATLQAFKYPPLLDLKATVPPKPRIFEIGRYSAIDLTTGEADPASVHPPRDLSGVFGKTFINIMKIILLMLLLLWLMSIQIHQLVKRLGQFFSRNPEIALLAPLAIVLIVIFNEKIIQNPLEEPFSWLEGVSVWPTVMLRLVAMVLSLIFLIISVSSLRKNDHKITQEFFGSGFDPGKPAKVSPPTYGANLCNWWPTRVSQFRRLQNWFKKKDEGISGAEKTVNKTSHSGMGTINRHYQEIRGDWEGDHARDHDRIRVKDVWEEYLCRGSFWLRLKRIIPLVIIYFGVCGLIIGFFGHLATPVRGDTSRSIDFYVLIAAIWSFLFLSFFVFDATRHCRRFVTLFLGHEPYWEPESLEKFRGRAGLTDAALGDWMLIRLIAQRTDAVGKLIFYPFIVWFVLFVSRLHYFDNWHTPLGLAIVIFMGAGLAWSCAFMLRRRAEKLRADILVRLDLKIHAAKPPDQKHKESLQRLFEEVKGIQKGAFALYYQNPVIQSLLVPVGGFGGVSLIELLSKLI